MSALQLRLQGRGAFHTLGAILLLQMCVFLYDVLMVPLLPPVVLCCDCDFDAVVCFQMRD